MSSHQIKYNEALVEKPLLKKHQKALIAANGHTQAANDGSFILSGEEFIQDFWKNSCYDFDSVHGTVGTDHQEHAIQTTNQKKITPNSGTLSKTATKQHEAAAIHQAKATAIAGNRTSDFGDHAKTFKGEFLDDVPGLAPVKDSSKNILQQLAAGLKTVQSKQLGHAVERMQSNFDNSVPGMILHGLDHPEPLAESVGRFVRAMTPQGIVNSAVGAVTGHDYMAGTKNNRFLAGIETALPFSGKFFAAGMGVLGRSGSPALRTFKSGEATIHFEKHGSELSGKLGLSSYTIEQYINDANHVIQHGKFVPELNGYVLTPSGKGRALAPFVGLDRATGEITTLHLKPVSFFERKAPSLGWSTKPRSEFTDMIGANRELGYRSPYRSTF